MPLKRLLLSCALLLCACGGDGPTRPPDPGPDPGPDPEPVPAKRADLQGVALAAHTYIGVGRPFKLHYSYTNVGTLDAPVGGTHRIWLSADVVASTDDLLLAEIPGEALAAGASTARDTTLAVPATYPESQRYLILQLDAANAVAEENEGNNASANDNVLVSYQPDLVGTNLKMSLFRRSDGAVQLNTTVVIHNRGNKEYTGQYWLRTYLSTDSILSSDDRFHSGSVPNVPFGESIRIEVWGGPAIPPGTYYGFLTVDLPEDDVPELDEDNNVTRISGLTLPPP